MLVTKVKIVRPRFFDQPWAVAASNLVAGVGEEPHLDELDVGEADWLNGFHDGHDADDADDVDDDGSAYLEDGGAHQETLQRNHRTTGLLSFSAMNDIFVCEVNKDLLKLHFSISCWNIILVFLTVSNRIAQKVVKLVNAERKVTLVRILSPSTKK